MTVECCTWLWKAVHDCIDMSQEENCNTIELACFGVALTLGLQTFTDLYRPPQTSILGLQNGGLWRSAVLVYLVFRLTQDLLMAWRQQCRWEDVVGCLEQSSRHLDCTRWLNSERRWIVLQKGLMYSPYFIVLSAYREKRNTRRSWVQFHAAAHSPDLDTHQEGCDASNGSL